MKKLSILERDAAAAESTPNEDFRVLPLFP